MKNFTNNFKQFTSRLSARWLIMALMMLVGTGSAWGWTIYYDNSGTPSWTDVYVVIGHGTWWRSYQMTKNNNVFQYTDTGWDDATFIAFSNSHKNSNGGNNTDWNSISNIRFGYGVSHVDKHVFTTNSSKLVDITHVSDVLNGNVIGFYVGEYTSWNQQQFYVKNSSITIPTCLSFESGNERYGVVYASSFDYTISHGDGTWNGPTLGEKAVLGTAYLVKNNNEVSKNAGTLPSCTFSIDNTIKAGETSTKSVTSSGKSKYGTQDYSEDSYYVKKSGETSLTKLEVVGSELQTQSLAVGEYTIYVLLFDGRIYAKGGEQALTVETACEKPDAPDFGTNGVEVCEGTQVTLPTIAGVTLKWYDENNQETTETFNATENKTYYAVVVGDCESDKTPYAITIKTKPTVTLNPTENTVCSGVALDGITRYVEIESTEGSQISWYAAAQGGDALAPSIALDATSYFAEATLNGCSSDRAKFTITEVLSAPTEVPNVTAPATICAGESAVLKLNNKGANYTYKVNEVEVDFTNNEYTVSPTITTDYKVSVENKCGSLSTTKTITVNPLPIISISGSEEAVLYEDVTLTATATDGATVKWYEGGVEKAEGLTYVVTSETATSKTVTAKAFLNGCESAVASHTVAFSAEDCSKSEVPTESTKIEIWCRETGSSQAGSNLTCYAWYKNSKNEEIKIFGNTGSTTDITKSSNIEGQNYTYRVWEYDMKDAGDYDVKVIFKKSTTSWDWQTSDLTAGKRNNRYFFTYDGSQNEQSKRGTKYSKSESLSVTTKTITAPAVKTVSATSVEGSGVVNFTGKIIKTGCAATSSIYYGYQFKKVGEAWPTTGVEASNTPAEGKLIPLTNSSETALHYEFSSGDITLDDGNYVFRAYIINGYNFTNGNYDQGVYYGLDKLVTVSTVKAPVTTAKIQLTESDGTPVDNDKKYCVGETAYIMVESDVKYTEISWKSQQGVDIVQTRLMNMYQFVVKGNDNIVVLLSNKHNVTPAESDPIEVYTFADPVLPTVSLNKVSICSNDAVGATVKLTNVVKGQTYQLYQQIDNGDGTFTEQAIGDAKTQLEDVTDKTELVLHTLTNTAATGKYFVKTYTAQCAKNIAATQPFTFTVVDASDVFIVFEPTSATTTPWMPAKFTVNASDKYTLTVPEGVVYNIDGNKVSVKIPLPEASTGGDEQYENVSFPQGAKTSYTIIANLATSGGVDNPCAAPAEATITLTPYVEPCTEGH